MPCHEIEGGKKKEKKRRGLTKDRRGTSLDRKRQYLGKRQKKSRGKFSPQIIRIEGMSVGRKKAKEKIRTINGRGKLKVEKNSVKLRTWGGGKK